MSARILPFPANQCDRCGGDLGHASGALCDSCADRLHTELADERNAEWWAE